MNQFPKYIACQDLYKSFNDLFVFFLVGLTKLDSTNKPGADQGGRGRGGLVLASFRCKHWKWVGLRNATGPEVSKQTFRSSV